MDVLLLLHDRLSVSMLLFMTAIGVWGLIAYSRGEGFGGSLAGAYLIGEILIALQVLAGVALIAFGLRAGNSTHYLYGATAILVMPFTWTYLKDRNPRQALLILSLVALFIAGLAIRGMTTAHS